MRTEHPVLCWATLDSEEVVPARCEDVQKLASFLKGYDAVRGWVFGEKHLTDADDFTFAIHFRLEGTPQDVGNLIVDFVMVQISHCAFAELDYDSHELGRVRHNFAAHTASQVLPWNFRTVLERRHWGM